MNDDGILGFNCVSESQCEFNLLPTLNPDHDNQITYTSCTTGSAEDY